jgi:hypothetical protein
MVMSVTEFVDGLVEAKQKITKPQNIISIPKKTCVRHSWQPHKAKGVFGGKCKRCGTVQHSNNLFVRSSSSLK